MSSEPITSVFNDGYIAEAYESYRRDPSSVDESWRQFFRFAEGYCRARYRHQPPATGALDRALLRKVGGAAALVDSIRHTDTSPPRRIRSATRPRHAGAHPRISRTDAKRISQRFPAKHCVLGGNAPLTLSRGFAHSTQPT